MVIDFLLLVVAPLFYDMRRGRKKLNDVKL